MGAADTAGAAGTTGVVGAAGAAGTACVAENAGASRRAGGAASAIDVAGAASAAGADRRAGGRGSDATPVACFARASAHQHADGKNKAKCTLLFERWQIKGRNALFFWALTAHHSFSGTVSWENSTTTKAKALHTRLKSCISAISCHPKNTSVHFDDNLPDKGRPRSKERPMRTQYAARAKNHLLARRTGACNSPEIARAHKRRHHAHEKRRHIQQRNAVSCIIDGSDHAKADRNGNGHEQHATT